MPRSFGISPSPAVTEPLDPGPSPAASPLQARFTRMDALVLAAIVVLGLVNLPQPFAWDQAMFTIGARELASGAVLYRDYWDPKQPGMFAFYWLGGRLFGFSEAGEHIFELLVMLTFGAALIQIVGSRYGRWMGRSAALLSVGLFFSCCSDSLHSQIECVAGLPLLLALVFAAYVLPSLPKPKARALRITAVNNISSVSMTITNARTTVAPSK